MYLGDSTVLPEFRPPKEKISEKKKEEKKNEWVVRILVWGIVGVIGIGFILSVINASPRNNYPKYIRECFSHLTTLDHSLLQESDPNTLVKEIKRDIVQNHLAPLCGSTYENMDKDMIQVFFPNVLFDPSGI